MFEAVSRVLLTDDWPVYVLALVRYVTDFYAHVFGAEGVQMPRTSVFCVARETGLMMIPHRMGRALGRLIICPCIGCALDMLRDANVGCVVMYY